MCAAVLFLISVSFSFPFDKLNESKIKSLSGSLKLLRIGWTFVFTHAFCVFLVGCLNISSFEGPHFGIDPHVHRRFLFFFLFFLMLFSLIN